MKKFVTLATLAVSLNAMATGEFLFSNVNAPALTNYWFGAVGPTATNANGFYYGFFIAPLGTSDPELFTFSGSYATNATTVGGFGRLVGG